MTFVTLLACIAGTLVGNGLGALVGWWLGGVAYDRMRKGRVDQ